MEESTTSLQPEREERRIKAKASVNLLWIGIISIVMFFAGLTSAYIVSKGGNFWVNLDLPQAFWISTGVILLSSFTLNMALTVIRKDRRKVATLWIVLTFILGIAFSVLQWQGWKEMIRKGNYLVGPVMQTGTDRFFLEGEYGRDFTLTFAGEELNYEDGRLFFPDGKELNNAQYVNLLNQYNTASSYIYILTAAHLLHLLGGLLYLLGVVVLALRRKFHSDNYLKIKLISIYWHFLGGLWVFLFLFLQFIH